MSSTIPLFSENALDSIATCTPAQHADARRYVERMAPDLLDAIFGGQP